MLFEGANFPNFQTFPCSVNIDRPNIHFTAKGQVFLLHNFQKEKQLCIFLRHLIISQQFLLCK